MGTSIRIGMLVTLAVALCACSLGSGQLKSRSVAVDGVTEVVFEGIGDLKIAQGERESLEISAEEDVLELVETEVRGEVLYIRLDRQFWFGGRLPTRGITYRLTVRDLRRVTLAGAGDIRIGHLETESLELNLDGAGSTEVDGLEADAFSLRHRGAGAATASGHVDTQDVLVAGAGSYKGADLVSRSARVDIVGAGDATVWAEEHLEARIEGVGSIRYYGNPTLEQRVAGVGQIKRMGSD